jgi:ABC-type glycerol-3-phosphate transport system substrate-binding protein
MTLRKTTHRRARRVTLGLTTLATSLVITACGSSSTSTNTNTTTSTTTAASASASTSANRTAFAKCMQQHGVTIPQRAAGGGTSTTHSGPPPGGSAGAGQGNSTRQAAFKACGANGQHSQAG